MYNEACKMYRREIENRGLQGAREHMFELLCEKCDDEKAISMIQQIENMYQSELLHPDTYHAEKLCSK